MGSQGPPVLPAPAGLFLPQAPPAPMGIRNPYGISRICNAALLFLCIGSASCTPFRARWRGSAVLPQIRGLYCGVPRGARADVLALCAQPALGVDLRANPHVPCTGHELTAGHLRHRCWVPLFGLNNRARAPASINYFSHAQISSLISHIWEWLLMPTMLSWQIKYLSLSVSWHAHHREIMPRSPYERYTCVCVRAVPALSTSRQPV